MKKTDEENRSLRDQLAQIQEATLRQFYAEVCAEAELIMAQTGTVSRAHLHAMKRVLKRKGIDVDAQP